MNLRFFTAALEWQSFEVLRRHARVHLRNWYTAAAPPLLEPFLMLLAFGFGLGSQIEALDWQGQEIGYMTYLGPGLVTYTVLVSSFFQGLFGAYVRMHYQKTWHGQLTSQVRLVHVVWGEALWASTLGTAYSVIVLLVLSLMGHLGWAQFEWIWAAPLVPILFVAGAAFGAAGLYFTSVVPTIDHMNLPIFLIVLPLGFTSSTYFPIPDDLPALQAVIQFNPLHHLTEGCRLALVNGQWSPQLPIAAGMLLVFILLVMPLNYVLLRRRVLGER